MAMISQAPDAPTPFDTPEAQAAKASKKGLRGWQVGLISAAVISVGLVVPQWAEISAAAGQAHVRAPDFSPLAAASPVVQIHVAAAVGAVALGGFLMVGRKGRALHRTLGWIWAMTMVVVAVASLFITNLNPGAWSWIHLLSGWTLIAVPFALFAARKHMVSAHRKTMMGLYYGGLFVAGAFTFVPGRMMWDIFFG